MTWRIEFKPAVEKQSEKVDINSRKLIKDYLQKILQYPHPKFLGKPLISNYKGLWRYRVHKFRIICKIEESKLTILVIKIAMRGQVYTD